MQLANEAPPQNEAPVQPGHTRGPLSVGYYRPTPSFLSVVEHIAVMDERGGLVALTGYSYTDQDPEIVAQSIADARLFAAAPDLLAACETALLALHKHPRGFGIDEDVEDRLVVALAKARGEAS